MEHEGFDGGAMHGPPGAWDFIEAIGTFSAFLLLLALLVLLSLVAYRFVSRLRAGGSVDSAEAILRERLARSEISPEEVREYPGHLAHFPGAESAPGSEKRKLPQKNLRGLRARGDESLEARSQRRLLKTHPGVPPGVSVYSWPLSRGPR